MNEDAAKEASAANELDFTFSDTDHANGVLRQASTIRDCADHLCDIIMFGGDAPQPHSDADGIRAHRIILASASDYFRHAFSGPAGSRREFCVDTVHHATLKSVVNYVYQGVLHASVTHVRDVLCTAKIFEMPLLAAAAEEFISEHQLTLQTCISIRAFAIEHACETLQGEAVNFIAQNLPLVLRQDEFIELDAEQLTELLHSISDVRMSPSSRIDDEDVKCEAAVVWLVHPSIDRRSYAESVMQNIDVSRLSIRMWRWLKKNDMIMSVLRDSKRKLEDIDDEADSGVYDKHPRTSTELQPNSSPAIKGRMYLLGGCGREAIQAFYQFSLSRKRWYELENALPWRRWAAGACVVDKNIYIAGGCKNPARNSMSSFTNQVDAYNVSSKQWTESIIPPMMEHRGYFAFAAFGDTIYAAGGRGNNDNPLSSVEKFQLNRKPIIKIENDEQKPVVEWVAAAPLSIPRASPGYAVIGSRLFVVGGSNSGEKSDTIEVFDHAAAASSNSGWVVLEHDECRMTDARSSPAVAAVNDEIFVIGGTVDDGLPTRRVEVINVTQQKRRRISPLSFARRGCTAVSAGQVVYVFGGRDEMGQYLTTMDMYDTRCDQWERDMMSCLPVATAFASAVVVLENNK